MDKIKESLSLEAKTDKHAVATRQFYLGNASHLLSANHGESTTGCNQGIPKLRFIAQMPVESQTQT